MSAINEKTKGRGGASKRARVEQPAKGRRFTAAQKKHALTLVAAGMKRTEVAEAIGTTVESIRRWVNEGSSADTPPVAEASVPAEAGTTSTAGPKGGSPYRPQDPGQGLSEAEQAAILELEKRHPSMGPAQIRAQLERLERWRLSLEAIARVLRAHGYEPVRPHGRPVGPQPVRFEAPHRNALWQLDFAELRIAGERQHVLVALDDFSRLSRRPHLVR